MDLPLPPDFREFLQLLNSAKAEYLVVGGYAVSYHGYPRPTGDLDIWIAIHPQSASKMMEVLSKFGFAGAGATAELFTTPGKVIRMGEPPVRIEILTTISGVEFAACFARRIQCVIDGITVNIISREDLISNKIAAGRPKDFNDLSHLNQGGSP